MRLGIRGTDKTRGSTEETDRAVEGVVAGLLRVRDHQIRLAVARLEDDGVGGHVRARRAHAGHDPGAGAGGAGHIDEVVADVADGVGRFEEELGGGLVHRAAGAVALEAERVAVGRVEEGVARLGAAVDEIHGVVVGAVRRGSPAGKGVATVVPGAAD
ncbi:uncharacterized protein PG986_006813 [Apiospora aurea]|uniref:Uncharacterized protein n=1 Tax=Apiospora aurea TaxID=335848 RepID=A0ABR1QAS7_9PEZI